MTPLLPSVTWQKHVMEYWWESSTFTAIPPTSASDVMGQHNEIEDITFGVTLKKITKRKQSCKGKDNVSSFLFTFYCTVIYPMSA